MAKTVHFFSDDFDFEAELIKLDRDKVYGYVTEKIYDPDNEPCQTAYLLEDGVTIIPSGGFALKTVVNGQEVSKKDLVAVDENMNPLVPISSIFDKDVVLKTDATLEDYLSLNVTSVYQLEITQGKGALLDFLQKGHFLTFDFNYRTGYDSTTAFVIANGEDVFAVNGVISEFEYLNIDQQPMPEMMDEGSDEEEIDFGML